jgi:glycyl-tRNA synthetase alpha subunit
MANVTELKRIRNFISMYPDMVDMGIWLDASSERDLDAVTEEDWSNCGITVCAAGWTVLLNGYRPADFSGYCVIHPVSGVCGDVETIAVSILELTWAEAMDLFNSAEDEVVSVLDELVKKYGGSDD